MTINGEIDVVPDRFPHRPHSRLRSPAVGDAVTQSRAFERSKFYRFEALLQPAQRVLRTLLGPAPVDQA